MVLEVVSPRVVSPRVDQECPQAIPALALGQAPSGHHAALMLLRREALALALARTAHPDGKQQMFPKVVKMPENHVP